MLILCAGLFVSCSDSSDDDKVVFTAKTITVPEATITAVGNLLVETPTGFKSANESIVTVNVNASNPTNVTVTSVAPGSTTVTVSGAQKSVSVPVTVAADGSITIGTPALIETATSLLPYTFDFTTLGTYADVTPVTYAEDTFFGPVALFSSGGGLRIRPSTNKINYNGESCALAATLAVGDSVTETPNRYCAIDCSKLNAPGTVTVSFEVKIIKSGSASGDIGVMALVDGSGKVLAVETGLKIKSGSDNLTISATVPNTALVKLLFSRNGAGGGGIDVEGIKATAN